MLSDYDSLTDFFTHLAVFALQVNMPIDEYWLGSPEVLDVYTEAYLRNSETRNYELDVEAWLIGDYVHSAISAAFSSSRHRYRYPNKPIHIDMAIKKNEVGDSVKTMSPLEAQQATFLARATVNGGVLPPTNTITI